MYLEICRIDLPGFSSIMTSSLLINSGVDSTLLYYSGLIHPFVSFGSFQAFQTKDLVIVSNLATSSLICHFAFSYHIIGRLCISLVIAAPLS